MEDTHETVCKFNHSMKKQLILALHTFHRISQRHYTKTITMMSISVIGDWYDDDDGYDDDGQQLVL